MEPLAKNIRWDRFWAKVEKTDGCWLWTGAVNTKGYPCFAVSQRSYLSHRLVYLLEHEELNPRLVVRRSCGNRLCVNPKHLYYSSPNERARDTEGVIALRGSKHGRAKLDEEKVREIRQRYHDEPKTRIHHLVKDYGVSDCSIRDILRGRAWKEAGGPISPRYSRT